MEILQLALQKPKLAVLDETDSGLDIDALQHRRPRRQHGRRAARHGRPDHHPLPAHPAHGRARRSCTIMFDGRIVKEGGPELVEQLEREGYGWIREEVGGGRLMGLDAGTARRSDEFPIARRDEGLVVPRLRRDVADAAQRDRGDGRVLRRRARDRPPRRLPARRRGDRALRGRAATKAAAWLRLRPGETVFTRNATEAINLVALHVGPRERRRRRPDRAHRDGAPLQPRAVADAAPRSRARARVRADRRRGHARPRRARRAACGRRRQAGRRRRTSRTCSARSTRSPRSSRARTPPARSSSIDGAQAVPQMPVDVADDRRRLLRLDRRTRPTARPASACCTARRELLEAMPPLLGGGHMISARRRKEARPGPSRPRKFEAGTSAIAEAHRPGRRRRLPRARSAWTPSARTSASSSPTRSSASPRCRACTIHGPRDADRPRRA